MEEGIAAPVVAYVLARSPGNGLVACRCGHDRDAADWMMRFLMHPNPSLRLSVQGASLGGMVPGWTGPLAGTFRPYSRSGVLMCRGRLPLLEFGAVRFAAVSVINHSLA
jgi:hypothetical protein